MFKAIAAFSGFSVDDQSKAKEFYTNILGLEVEVMEGMGMNLILPDGVKVFVYPKSDHEPATYTVLNFAVEDIDAALSDLAAQGVQFEKYEGMYQDEKGIMRGKQSNEGPDIAWFKDPAGNVLSILQD